MRAGLHGVLLVGGNRSLGVLRPARFPRAGGGSDVRERDGYGWGWPGAMPARAKAACDWAPFM
ncbi:hypothetical protein GmRootV35_34430 [Variovorax sp. V35]